ncbi:MAG: hypothetical protein AAFR59_20365, partial [Bacteroidota bacterium]
LDPDSTNNNSEHIADIQWLFEGGDGLQSVGNLGMQTFVVQSNLSTETNPGQAVLQTDAMIEATETPNGVLNSIYDFIKLLWECSITRSGGYYLFYQEVASNEGFPSTIFDRSGNAKIRLFVTYAKSDNNQLQSYMNCAVTGDKIDTNSAVVYAKAQAIQNLSYTTSTATETLSSIAAQYHILLGELASLNETSVQLKEGSGPIILKNLVYEVGLPSFE